MTPWRRSRRCENDAARRQSNADEEHPTGDHSDTRSRQTDVQTVNHPHTTVSNRHSQLCDQTPCQTPPQQGVWNALKVVLAVMDGLEKMLIEWPWPKEILGDGEHYCLVVFLESGGDFVGMWLKEDGTVDGRLIGDRLDDEEPECRFGGMDLYRLTIENEKWKRTVHVGNTGGDAARFAYRDANLSLEFRCVEFHTNRLEQSVVRGYFDGIPNGEDIVVDVGAVSIVDGSRMMPWDECVNQGI